MKAKKDATNLEQHIDKTPIGPVKDSVAAAYERHRDFQVVQEKDFFDKSNKRNDQYEEF